MDQETKFKIFFTVWVVLGLTSFVYIRSLTDPKVKRERIVQVNVVAAVLFTAFLWFMSAQIQILIIAIPFLAFITFLNIRGMKVCQKCGAVQKNAVSIKPPKFCSRCGEQL